MNDGAAYWFGVLVWYRRFEGLMPFFRQFFLSFFPPQVLVCCRYYHNIPPFRDKAINGELSFRYPFF